MKNKSTLAKLLSEEDINVVHKQMETAYFDSKKRELGLPIWKDEEMTPTIYDLMISHEIGHALWTPLDMLEKAAVRKINHSFVNIIEDARIEKKVKTRYPGTVGVFNRGYEELLTKDFFGTSKKDIATYNLIDRINVFFKSADTTIPFSDEEKVWVEKVSTVETPDDVLDLAEELYKWMEENSPEDSESGETDDHKDMTDGSGEGAPGLSSEKSESSEASEGEGEGSGEEKSEEGNSSASTSGEGEEEGDSSGSGKGEENDDSNDGDDGSTSGASADDGKTDDKSDTDPSEGGDSTVGGVNSDGKGSTPTASTDSAFGKAMDALRDKLASDRVYANIPKVNLSEVVVPFDTVVKEFYGAYLTAMSEDNQKGLYFNKCLEEVETLKNESKKTVAYMVKEFEMKKAADQYARAATSKTGSLDMGKLHTYKYNEDLFKKVTTLPGATNHGMVMVLDWSGSMCDNLKGTIAQLMNLVWFCRKVKIPFTVFAFSDAYGRARYTRPEGNTNDFKCGDIAIRPFKLLEFFSSNMTTTEEMKMMHTLMMYSNRYSGYRDCSEVGYPYSAPQNYELGGTPLNDAIIAMMEYVPKFKIDSGVQKVNTIFLTDGCSNSLEGIYDYRLNTETGEHSEVINSIPQGRGWGNSKAIFKDPVINKSYEKGKLGITDQLLEILKGRVDGYGNLVGFFIAGSGKSGRVDKRTLMYLLDDYDRNNIMEKVKFINKNKFLAIDSLGYDEYYVLPGGKSMMTENEGLDDELIGASKAKLKSAFGKSMKGRIESRQLLNKFVSMVA